MKYLLQLQFSKICRKQPTCRVVMLHVGRCGSTVLGDMLNRNGQIRWAGEVFQLQALSSRHRLIVGSEEGNAQVIKELQLVGSKKPVFGFEVKYLPHQHMRRLGCDAVELIKLLQDANLVKYIHLTRKNTLKQLVSALIAESSNIYQTRGSLSQPLAIKLDIHSLFKRGSWYETEFDGEIGLLSYLDYVDRHQNIIEQQLRNLHSLELQYESDVENDPIIAYSKVCQFVGAPVEQVQVQLRKINPFPLSELIANFREVKEHLTDTQYSWMLD